jgi:4-hydroxybenzoate polyprenyltransferase
VKGDLAAGIQTLPVVFGERKLKYILFSVCVVQHMILALAMAWRILTPSIVFFVYSFIAGGLVIIVYSPVFESGKSWLQRKFRSIMIDGESMILVIFSMCLPY